MTTATTHKANGNTTEATLLVAVALSENTEKLGFTTGHGQEPRERSMPTWGQERMLDAMAKAKGRLGLSATAPGVRCYEADREGVCRHPFLLAQGINKSLDHSRQLMQLEGMGSHGSWWLVMECFGWRAFNHGREVGGVAGLDVPLGPATPGVL